MRRTSIIDKILARIKIVGNCHEWQGGHSGHGRGGGYPRMWLDGHTVAVRRVVYTHYHGFIPRRLQVDHICENRLCLNPDHLELVTNLENQRRKKSRHVRL